MDAKDANDKNNNRDYNTVWLQGNGWVPLRRDELELLFGKIEEGKLKNLAYYFYASQYPHYLLPPELDYVSKEWSEVDPARYPDMEIKVTFFSNGWSELQLKNFKLPRRKHGIIT